MFFGGISMKGSVLTVKEFRKILKDYKDDDVVSLFVTSFNEEGARAQVTVSHKKKRKVLMEDESSVW